ncbi:hypothetical protein AR1Y2_1728 [Anaerostipes rhamnosivorans]|uniref:Uncharacterized protein n=1 Tax=Anaerostipes rhamnosivorans TaxID=1229621 RepID=A0A4P8IBV9_9FIRM|nr:hypothetical protein AR1Y2_1728 [Anaerostipes rhamnosivorans]
MHDADLISAGTIFSRTLGLRKRLHNMRTLSFCFFWILLFMLSVTV